MWQTQAGRTVVKVKVVILFAMRRTVMRFIGVASHSTKLFSEINPDPHHENANITPYVDVQVKVS